MCLSWLQATARCQVELEQKLDEIIPDILVTCDGKQFIIEIYVTHALDDEKKAKIKDLQISAIEIDLSRFHKEMIDKENLRQEICNIANFSWVYDADFDLIEQKKEIIQQFGMKLSIQRGGVVFCPRAKNLVTQNFCKKCVFCWIESDNSVRCGLILPILIKPELRKMIENTTNIFINQNKIMSQEEAEKYKQSHFGWKMREAIEHAQMSLLLQSRRYW